MTASPSAPPPMRLMSRRLTDFLVRATAALAEPHGGDLTQTLAFTTVACANVSHLGYASPEAALAAEGADSEAAGLRRPVSVNAVARSLELPFETVRLRMQRLEQAGLCERSAAGMIAPPRVFAPGAGVRASWAATYDALLETLAQMARAGVDLPAVVAMFDDGAAAGEPPPPLVAVRIVLDAVLRVMERFATAFGSLGRGYLFCAVVAANTRHLDAPPSPPLSYAYTHTPVPDEIRRPVSIRRIAREIGVPLETTRRNAERLVADRWFASTPAGLIVPNSALEAPLLVDLSQTVSLNIIRMLVELRRAGVRFEDVAPALQET